MSVRSCLLCGRALSRWNGAGDDFCSREHRNQYRLRRSMDRLQEANQVATVMRRRESPRPLKASRLINGGSQEPRAFLQNRTAPPPPASTPHLAPACTPRLAPAGDAVTIAPAASGSATHSVCPAPMPVRTSAPVPPPLRMAMRKPEPEIAPPVRGIQNDAEPSHMRRRAMAYAWRSGGSPVTDGILRRLEPPRVYPLAEGARAAAFGPGMAAAAKGRALRVSLAAGFRIPEWHLRPVTYASPEPAGIVWPGPRPLPETPSAPGAAQFRSILPEPGIVPPEMRTPASPPEDFGGVFRWPGLLEVSLQLINREAPHRAAFVPFTSSEEYSGKERTYEYRN